MNKVRVLLGLVFVVFNTVYAQRILLNPAQVESKLEQRFNHKSTAPITYIKDFSPCQGTTYIEVPIYVNQFNYIGAVSLTLSYDPNVLTYQSFVNNSGFPGLTVVEGMPGTLTTAAFTSITNGISFPDSSILYTIQFQYAGGISALEWYDDGSSCEYSGPAPLFETLDDMPITTYYISGIIQELLSPASVGPIIGPENGMVCKGQMNVPFYVEPVLYASQYFWTLPYGASIVSGSGTNSIAVSFDTLAISGTAHVNAGNECGVGGYSPPFEVVVNDATNIITQPLSPEPITAGQGVATFIVEAAGEQLTYQWQEFVESWIDVQDQGVYNGTTTNVLKITNPDISMNGNKYRCLVAGFCPPMAFTNGEAVLSVLDVMSIDLNKNRVDDFKAYVSLSQISHVASIFVESAHTGKLVINLISINGQNMGTIEVAKCDLRNCTVPLQCKNWPKGIYCASVFLNTPDNVFCTNLKFFVNK